MQSVWLCSKMHRAKPCVRDGRGAQRSRVRSTRDGTPGQPARAVLFMPTKSVKIWWDCNIRNVHGCAFSKIPQSATVQAILAGVLL